MKKSAIAFSVVLILSINLLVAQKTTISLNSLGYQPQSLKKASIVGEAQTFLIKRADDQSTVFQEKLSAPVFQKDVNQNVSLADFSSLTKEGKYYLELPDGSKSAVFEISRTVYNQAFYTSMRAFYLWRCGTAVDGIHNGHHYSHEACH
jgi:endoglucanase